MLKIFEKEEKNFKKNQKDFLILLDFGELYYLG